MSLVTYRDDVVRVDLALAEDHSRIMARNVVLDIDRLDSVAARLASQQPPLDIVNKRRVREDVRSIALQSAGRVTASGWLRTRNT